MIRENLKFDVKDLKLPRIKGEDEEDDEEETKQGVVRSRPVFSNNRRFHASPSRGRHPPTPKINTGSLEETLEEHRFANRTVVRRIKVRGTPNLLPESYGGDKVRHNGPLEQKHLINTQRELWKLRKLTRDLARLNERQMKKLYPTSLKSPPPKTEQQSPVRCDWLEYMNEQESRDGYSRLSDEIKAFERYMSEIQQEKEVVRRVIGEMEEILKPVAGDSNRQPMLVGSRYTGMETRNSNVDLMIPIEDPDGLRTGVRGPSVTRPKITAMQMDILVRSARLLRATGTFSNVTVKKEHVPFVSAVHSATGRNARICCGLKPHSSMEYVLSYKAEFPTLRSLYVALRMVLEARGMFGVENRTVDAYGLTMMIVAALKLGEGKFDRLDLAKQFLHTLRFYKDLDLIRYGISVEPPALFRKRAHARVHNTEQLPHVRGQKSIAKRSITRGDKMLCLQDPADFMNDLGMSSFDMPRLRDIFGKVHDDILGKVEAWDGEAQAGKELVSDPNVGFNAEFAESERPSLLKYALGSNYDHLEVLRDKAICECS
ncbi:hypothetical protein MGYG_05671 [Nannizzia gypsea CBS 118893]|uniref:Polynucleotide adenylyltransferase n=1 Tax=Arthroderma gypseum (strain ATCC MYA-4604 / CBS 118893) TaxID=535722 RepID=E4UX87_ARTGP|nr:hypothetical protein MGYG_05671 [Nannizzia gypsea CBS 118893]EFR02674.1 hypothetical protein MGYG_05671 [Nannizzia gypsea CBS 118893]